MNGAVSAGRLNDSRLPCMRSGHSFVAPALPNSPIRYGRCCFHRGKVRRRGRRRHMLHKNGVCLLLEEGELRTPRLLGTLEHRYLLLGSRSLRSLLSEIRAFRSLHTSLNVFHAPIRINALTTALPMVTHTCIIRHI